MSLEDRLRIGLSHREAESLARALRVIPDGTLDLASNDYLGLARHPRVVEAAIAATWALGGGARASRLVSGHTPLHAELERDLACFKGAEGALLFPTGYQANLAVLSSLPQPGDLVCCDKRNHASLIDGCFLAAARGAEVRYYGNSRKLERLLDKTLPGGATRFIVTDTVYSMDGDVADLPELLELANRFDATLIIDDAHGTGALGPDGRGALEHFGIGPQDRGGFQPPTQTATHPENVITIGTLSKALGSQGGFVAASQLVIDWLVNTARPFIYTTALNPAACGAALAALRVLAAEPCLVETLRSNTCRLAEGLQAIGYDARHQPSPIIPVMIGDPATAVRLSAALLEHGLWCPAIRPPTVPSGTSRLRVTASAGLNAPQIDFALKAFLAARTP